MRASVPIYRLPASDPQARACLQCGMRGQVLFGALDDEALEEVHRHIVQVAYPAGHGIYLGRHPDDAVFTLRDGIVRFERASIGAERRILRVAGPGDLLGQELLLGRKVVDDVIACTDVRLCRIPIGVITGLGERHPTLLRELMERWQQALEDSQSWLVELSTGSARHRMLRLLQKMAQFSASGDATWLPTRVEMGDMLNLTIETTSRQVSQLRREGVLHGVNRRFATVDRERLQQALEREIAAA